jgi:hypothetical protein
MPTNRNQAKPLKPKVHHALYALLISAASFSSNSWASHTYENLSISGFGRIVGGYLDTNQADFRGYSDSISLQPETLAGLQATYDVNDSFSVTTQAVIRAEDSASDSIINWAYATWQPDDNLVLKAGRMRTPFFALSDVVDVGYSYPWISAPQQVYNAWLFPTFDGLDASWGYSTDQFDTTFEAYLGQYNGQIDLNNNSTDYNVNILGGVIAKINYNNFSFRASHHRGDVDIGITEIDTLSTALHQYGFTSTANALDRKGWVDVDELAMSYDSYDYFFRSEWIRISADMEYLTPLIKSYYLTAGYSISPFTFHVTYANSDVSYKAFPQEIPLGYNDQLDQLYYAVDSVRSQLSNDSLQSWTLGVRWDFMPKLALKTEVSLLDGESDANSFFESIQSGFNRDATLYKMSLEWVF